MTLKCSEGHELVEGTFHCEYGHPVGATAQEPLDANTNSLMLVQLMQQLVTLQQENIALRRNQGDHISSSVKKPDRPRVDPESTDNDSAIFVDSWNRYKSMARLTQLSEIRNELRAACSPEIEKLLFNLIGPAALNNASEDDLLKYIKSVAVRGLHKEVHSQQFHAMHQKEGELVTHFLARLRSQANFCEFSVKCNNSCNSDVSYSDDMISGQLIAGLNNVDHQNKVLAEAAKLPSLQSKFDLLVSLETTDKSTNKLQTPPTKAGSQRSDYKKGKRPPQKQSCKGCGKNTHPTGKSMRRVDCPAFAVTGNICGKKGHFPAVCFSNSTKPPKIRNQQKSNKILQTKVTSSPTRTLHCYLSNNS